MSDIGVLRGAKASGRLGVLQPALAGARRLHAPEALPPGGPEGERGNV